ncbi:MAG: translation initiation factor IF-3 [Leptolyngbya sp. PLA1]|nr:translation initiation factor IF-3 [Leptolyngbya sp. PLA1]
MSRFSRDQGPMQQRTRVNMMIRISPVRVIGPNEEMLGVLETNVALQKANELGMDLVEISPDARPPVCKIMDYGKYKYELGQKQRKARAAAKSTELKELRLGRSVKIDPHDVQIRIDQARRFLMHGHKVMVTQRFKGREIAHRELGLSNLKEVATQLADIAKLEQPPRWFGKSASILLAPDKNKVEGLKRKLEKERAAKIAAGEHVEEEKSIEALEAELALQQVDDGPDDSDIDGED